MSKKMLAALSLSLLLAACANTAGDLTNDDVDVELDGDVMMDDSSSSEESSSSSSSSEDAAMDAEVDVEVTE